MNRILIKTAKKVRGKSIFLIGILCLLVSGISEENVLSDDTSPGKNVKSSLLHYKIPDTLLFCGERVPMESRDVRERLDREFLLALGRESQIILWLKRSKRYFPHIEARLKYYNLPDDLKYVSIAESDLYAYAISNKGAAGIWQFIKSTGIRFGLKKHKAVDERFNFSKATDAAITYLQELHKQFGKWTLAIAAYNCGEKRVHREMHEQMVNDFFDLNLPLETEEYLFRIMAIKLIMSHPERYGFVLEEDDYYPSLETERVEIFTRGRLHIRSIADAAQTTFKVIKELNPELKGYRLTAGKHALLIPHKYSDEFHARLKNALNYSHRKKRMVYRVERGDTLFGIASKFDVSLEELMKWNEMRTLDKIYPGQAIIYYKPLSG